jgi:hypothetical protein
LSYAQNHIKGRLRLSNAERRNLAEIGQRLQEYLRTPLSAPVSSASAHAFLVPFAALIMLQLLVLASASRLPIRI